MDKKILSSQFDYVKLYKKDDLKFIKLANKVKEVLSRYIDQETDLMTLKANNNWIYVVNCRLNPNNTVINVHIGASRQCEEIVLFLNVRRKNIRFYCAKTLEKSHNMPELNFHANHFVDEMLEWDAIKLAQENLK